MKGFVSRIAGRLLDRVLGLRYSSGGPQESVAFVNLVMTDLRPSGIEQKARSFFSIVDLCLREEQTVRLIVPVGRGAGGAVQAAYLNAFARFLGKQKFELIFATPYSQKKHYIAGAVVALFFSLLLMKRFPGTHRNIAVLLSANYLRIRTFYKLFDDFPAKNWFGLTGNTELQALQCRRDAIGSTSVVNALQFGQASMDQYHFAKYSVDKMFVYDAVSRDVYRNLGINAGKIFVSGSPEFELSLSRIGEKSLDLGGDLVVLFIDQPVRQRSEYSLEYTQRVFQALQSISEYSGVRLSVKPHPRGSAFPDELLSEVRDRDISELLSEAHIVVGFFSNLVDLALLTGREVFCFGADRVLDKGKVAWMSQRGCHITNDTRDLERCVQQSVENPKDLTRKIIERRQSLIESESASEKILSALGGDDVT